MKALGALGVVALASSGFGAAGAPSAAADPGPDCLWAGASHHQGAEIIAGGSVFTCTTAAAVPRWERGATVRRASTVPNPGSTGNPFGRFSLGARQPGTDYNDYCVGSQLIEGADSVYEAVADRTGFVFWKAAGPIGNWAFDQGAPRPGPSWRSASLCDDGVLG
ncbi:hypothetical protein D5S18_00690 [Nocardia panacis]|uniref:Secreted protein n=1 Tax=Nocardia panacis TaxID=2340916 RepID=A0A3A4KTW4_9NOCA|nr:hypothetical protein D5S18_00690 [Nocardia panacis]